MHGKPAGRFSRSPLESGADAETRRVLGPSNVAPDAAAHLEEAWRKMRAAAVSTRQHHRAEGAAVLDAFERVDSERRESAPTSRRRPGDRDDASSRPRMCSPAEFKRAWFALGVRDLSDAQVKAVFAKVGHDARGNMPYDVFVKALVLKSGRVLGLEHIKKGPFEDADDARFMGKITYPQCRRGVQAPSDWLTAGRAITARSASVPTLRLEPDFAHGFPGRGDLGNSLLQTNAGALAYYVGALGVVYDPRMHAQRFFRGHTGMVRSIAAHPDGETFATGQDGHNAVACVWSSTRRGPDGDLQELARVVEPLGFSRAFACVAFSPDGAHLLTVGSDDKHTVFLWDWKRHTRGNTPPPLMSMPGMQAAVPAVWGAAFNPHRRFLSKVAKAAPKPATSRAPFASGQAAFGPAPPIASSARRAGHNKKNSDGEKKRPSATSSFEFVTFGAKHVKLWRLDGAGRWGGRPLRFAGSAPFSAHAAAFLPGGNLLVGKDDGGLALFDLDTRALKRLVGRRASHADAGAAPSVRDPARENTKGVRALAVLESENAVVSAGADGRILAWRLTEARDDVEDTPFEEIQLSHPMGANHAPPRIRSLAVVASRERADGADETSGRTSASETAASREKKGVDERKAPAARAADRPWGVDGDDEPLPPGRFPTKPRGVTPWALADETLALEETLEATSLASASASASGSASGSPLFSRVACFAGTTACDLWEADATRARVRIAGAGGTLDAVAWQPDAPVCATLGSDGWVRLCDAERRAQIAAEDVGAGAAGRSVAFSGDGKLLAAGFADGRVAVLRARTLEALAETTPVARERHRREREPGWSESARESGGARVEALAFSPDSTLLAAAGADRAVRVFANVAGAFALVATCAGHSATVRALDWSEDGALLRSQCVGGELLHWRAPTFSRGDGEASDASAPCILKPFPGDVRDARWRTHSATVGFPVMGIWEPGRAASTRVVGALDRSPDARFVVAGDDAGDLRVLNYPCVARAAPSVDARRAHGARVGAVAFSGDGAWVASVGTADKTLVVWRARERTPGVQTLAR